MVGMDDRIRRLAKLRRPPGGGQGFTRQQFEQLVVEALRGIPETFRSRLENVGIVIEERPSRQLLRSLGMDADETLFGYYEGIPLTERGDWYNLAPPDRIIIFRQPILEVCSSPDEIRTEVRKTVLHEVAHFYGIDDAALDEMGY